MRAIVLLFCVIESVISFCQNPSVQWANIADPSNNSRFEPIDSHADKTGNVVVVGSMEGTVQVSPDTLETSSYHAAIIKYNAQGQLAWAGNFDSEAGRGNSTAMLVTHDPQGNIYVSGFLNGTVDIDPGPGTYTMSSSSTSTLLSDDFIIKLNNGGQLLWAHQFTTTVSVQKITVDSTGNVILAGDYRNSADLDPGTGIYTSSINIGNFVLKLNANGQFVWAATAANGGGKIHALSTDGLGRINFGGYVFGQWSPADLAPGPQVYSCTINAGFIMRLDGSGNFIDCLLLPGSVLVSSIETDRYNNRFVAGVFYSGVNQVDIDPGPGVTTVAALSTGFIEKIDSNNVLNWSRTISTVTAYPYYIAYLVKLLIDASGNVFVCADGRNGFLFQNTVGSSSVSIAGTGTFYGMARYDQSGNLQWAGRVGPALTSWLWQQTALPFTILRNGDIYFSSTINSTCELEPVSGSYSIAPAVNFCAFTEKLSPCRNNGQIVVFSSRDQICEGEVSQLLAAGALHYEWSPVFGASSSITVAPAQSTIYEVAGYDSLGCMSSASIEISVSPCTAINEIPLFKVRVIPVPATDYVTVESEISGTIFITDCHGKRCAEFEWTAGTQQIDISSLPAGVYFCEFKSEAGINNSKIIKQ